MYSKYEGEERRNPEGWKLDKHIPVAGIITVVLQAVFFIWWLSGLEHSLKDHERRILLQESSKLAERTAVTEMELRGVKELQLEMNRKLDRVLELRQPGGRNENR